MEDEFRLWFEENENRFSSGQSSLMVIAYQAWLNGREFQLKKDLAYVENRNLKNHE